MVAVVEATGVWKRFDTVQAVKGITFRVERGSLLGLIGPNGAGKTSLMKMIATLSKPDRGQLRVLGRDVRTAVAPIRRRLGYMPAEFGRMPSMTVEEYISYFGAAAGVPQPERRKRVADVLAIVDLAGRKDSLVSAGSTGIKQRILIAKTLVHDPELLVLDEPAAGLDPRARIEIREVLRELNRLGKTILVSSHILADLEEICDEVAIIEHGELVAQGTLDELTRAQGEPGASQAWQLDVAPEALAAAHEVLATLPTVSDLRALEGSLRCELALEASQANDANPMLAALLAAEVPILGVKRVGPRLEDVFMKQTDGVIG